MKKLMNAPETMLSESLRGFAFAHRDILVLDEAERFVRRRVPKLGKVGLVSGGGSGHEPLHAGFVGAGMLDAAVPGEVFTSPTPDRIDAAVQAAEQGAGVLLIVKNYEGDVMNFEMARHVAAGEVATVVVDDDVAVERSTFSLGRRGVAGTMIVEKMLGAAAEQGRDLAPLAELGQRIVAATRSMGVALSGCTVPAAGKPNFVLAEDEVELGVGIHGEPGRRRVKLAPADALTDEMLAAMLDDLAPPAGSRLLLLVNGFGATPLMELYLMLHAARTRLTGRGFEVARTLVGTYVTSLDMAGCSLTITLLDEELAALWDAPVHTAALRWG